MNRRHRRPDVQQASLLGPLGLLDGGPPSRPGPRPKRRGPRPTGFFAALSVVVKYGRMATRPPPAALSGPPAHAQLPAPTPARRAGSASNKRCPRCGRVGEVERDFGSRRVAGRRRPQSWCRRCRRVRTGLWAPAEVLMLPGLSP